MLAVLDSEVELVTLTVVEVRVSFVDGSLCV